MNHILVLKLKEAGFPLEVCELDGCFYQGDSLDADGKNYHYPTLSQLIKETFDPADHFELSYNPETTAWSCIKWLPTTDTESAMRSHLIREDYRKTPEEAVAHVWLAKKHFRII